MCCLRQLVMKIEDFGPILAGVLKTAVEWLKIHVS
jgi:hypothetical protein